MQFGDYRVEIIPDTEFRLDGGAMFGIVPRVLWERVCAPDDLNRIKLNMNCLFVETPSERILIETGIEKTGLKKKQRSTVYTGKRRLSDLYLKYRDIGVRTLLSSLTPTCISTTRAAIPSPDRTA